jgi:hypothetical protein
MGAQWKVAPGGKLSRHLYPLLKALDPDLQCERTFDWLFLPRAVERTALETRLASALVDHCRASSGRDPRKALCDPDVLFADGRITGRSRRLEFDFYLPSFNVALEFDERQHFTDERRCTLELYDFIPDGFDLNRWIALCSPRIIDAFPPCRDWERAYRDAVRDLRARANGMPLVRLYYRDFSRPSIADIEVQSSLERSIAYARQSHS